MSAESEYRAWQRANEAPTVYAEDESLAQVLAEKDAEIARLTAELGHWQRVFGDDAFALVQRAEAERDEANELLREVVMDWVPEEVLEGDPACVCSAHRASAFLARAGEEAK